MDMLKKLKGLFVVEDANQPEQAVPNTEISNQEVSNSSMPTSSKSNAGFEPASLEGKAPDPKFIDILMKAIEENNLQGFDYLEYKSSLQSLTKMNMDDATRYQSAMAMAKTMGASPEKILQSANHYLTILKAENDKFQQAVDGQKLKISQDQQSGIASLQAAIVQKQKQVEQLNKEIIDDKQKLEKLQADINAGAGKIAETSAKFSQAYNIVRQQIAEDVKNITTYASKV